MTDFMVRDDALTLYLQHRYPDYGWLVERGMYIVKVHAVHYAKHLGRSVACTEIVTAEDIVRSDDFHVAYIERAIESATYLCAKRCVARLQSHILDEYEQVPSVEEVLEKLDQLTMKALGLTGMELVIGGEGEKKRIGVGNSRDTDGRL